MPIYKDGFIKPEKLHMLEEDYRSDDLLNRNNEITKFSAKVGEIEKNAILGFVGPFGSGKSTFLNQFKKQFEGYGGKWFDFESRKYPDRANLWENFVLEIARGINEPIFDKTIIKIDGKQNDGKKKLLNLIGEIPYLGAVKHFDYFLNTSPAKRTFEIQNILKELFDQTNSKDIIVVVEDIDRSGDAGIYFLETLHNFIHNLESEKNIKIIIPIGNDCFTKNINSYLKCLDYRQEFNPENIVLNRFVNELFIDEILKQTNVKGQIQSFLEGTFKEFGGQMTIRKLKHILRGANINYKLLANDQGEGIDPRLSIMFETAKNITKDNQAYFDFWKNNGHINNHDLFSALVWCVITDDTTLGVSPIPISIYQDKHTQNGMITKLADSESFGLKNFDIRLVDYQYLSNSNKNGVLRFQKREGESYLGISKLYLYV